MSAAERGPAAALRFFCGPNAHKSAALAKQQKKRPRGDEKQAAAASAAAAAVDESESEVELASGSEDSDKPNPDTDLGLDAAVRSVLRAMTAGLGGPKGGHGGVQKGKGGIVAKAWSFKQPGSPNVLMPVET